MSISISVTLNTAELERIANQLDVRKHEVGRKIGPDFEASAKAHSRVDTGAMRSAFMVSYPGGDVIARLSNDIEYTKYNEFGTYKMAAQPMMIPAIEEVTGLVYDPNTWKILFT